MVASTQYACAGTLHQRCGHLHGHRCGTVGRRRAARDRILDGHLRRLRIVLVDDQIGLVVADIRAIMPKAAGDGAGLETKQGGMELGAIVGEIQHGLARCAEDGGAIRWPQRGEVAFRGFSHPGKIAELQVHIVEQVSYKTFRHGRHVPVLEELSAEGISPEFSIRLLPRLCCQGSRLFDFELGDHLRLAFVEDLKIVLAKISDSVALGVADHGAHHHQLYIHFECGGFVVRSEFGRVLLSFGLRGRVGSGSLLNTDLLNTDLSEDGNWANRKPGNAQQKTEKQVSGDKETCGRTA